MPISSELNSVIWPSLPLPTTRSVGMGLFPPTKFAPPARSMFSSTGFPSCIWPLRIRQWVASMACPVVQVVAYSVCPHVGHSCLVTIYACCPRIGSSGSMTMTASLHLMHLTKHSCPGPKLAPSSALIGPVSMWVFLPSLIWKIPFMRLKSIFFFVRHRYSYQIHL